MLQGRVKYFNPDKGYGFIITDNGVDYFYHVSDVKDVKLTEVGDTVQFEVGNNKKGECAKEIKVISKAKETKVTEQPQQKSPTFGWLGLGKTRGNK
jgi:cold shock protein